MSKGWIVSTQTRANTLVPYRSGLRQNGQKNHRRDAEGAENKKSLRLPRPRRLCGEFFLFGSGLSGLGFEGDACHGIWGLTCRTGPETSGEGFGSGSRNLRFRSKVSS